MTTLLARSFLLSIISLLISFSWPISATANTISNLRNQRYCEILLAEKKLAHADMEINNTIELNNCPEEAWKNITPETIKAETGVSKVYLNGPRYWILDGIENSTIKPQVKTLGGIEMREVAALKIPLKKLSTRSAPYKLRQVERQTTWVYLAGKKVYELIDPEGQVFVMQSYSIQKRLLSEETLASLDTELHLPRGWHFRSRVLIKNAYLTPANNIAVIVQDDLLNTYQLEIPLFK